MEKSATPTTGKVRKHIPLDIAFSILSKLPPKSLRRFQCVSKSWSMLFQNPYFKRIYGNHIIHRRNHSDYDDASIILGHTILEPVRGSDEELWITTLYFIFGKRFEKRVELNLAQIFVFWGLLVSMAFFVSLIYCSLGENLCYGIQLLMNSMSFLLALLSPYLVRWLYLLFMELVMIVLGMTIR
jgi:hypothetical protein